MSKVILDLNNEQVERIIESLSLEEKLKLTEKLEKETLGLRWKQILKDIDSRLKKFPIPKQEVIKEIRAYRKEKYA
mgnify:CR=1 FL=1